MTLILNLHGVCRLAFSVLLFYLFQAVTDRHLGRAYIYAGMASLIWYLNQMFLDNGALYTYVLAARLKSGLSSLLFSKITRLTSFFLKSTQLGMITNLIANDLGSLSN
jgi:hypothetical protein